MSKMFGFFGFVFAAMSMLVAFQTGGGAFNHTQLNGQISATAMSIVTDSNVGFAPSGVIWIDNERITYSALVGATTFTVSARGTDTTAAILHLDNAIVKSDDSGVMGIVFGFDIGSLFDSWGLFSFPIILGKFFTITIPHIIGGNIQQALGQSTFATIIVNLWLVSGGAFIFGILMSLISARGR